MQDIKDIKEIKEIKLYTTDGSISLLWDKYAEWDKVSQEDLQSFAKNLYDDSKQFACYTKDGIIHGINKSSVLSFDIKEANQYAH